MSLVMTATEVTQTSDGVWEFDMPPYQVKHFGKTNLAVGAVSVVLLENPSFDPSRRTLSFDAEHATAINIGSSVRVVGICTNERTERFPESDTIDLLAPGDREFIDLANKELSPSMAEAAASILRGVRTRSPGDLKRGQARNFSNTPDNFWYVIIQPRINELSFTVRGTVQHFSSVAKLPIKDDRGNTLFKVKDVSDVAAALEIIFFAKRKN